MTAAACEVELRTVQRTIQEAGKVRSAGGNINLSSPRKPERKKSFVGLGGFDRHTEDG